MRKALFAFALAAGALSAAEDLPPDPKPDANKLLPYVVPADYFQHGADKDKTIHWPLGHGLIIALMYEMDGLARNVMPEELPGLGLTADEARAKAIRNLEDRVKAGAIDLRQFTGPDKRPFVLVAGDWRAATCILLPMLRTLGARQFGTDEICVSIPHREALLMFAKGDPAYRELMRRLVRENESDGRKPLTFELFELTAEGPREFRE